MHPKRSWVVVADAAQAAIFTLAPDGATLAPLEGCVFVNEAARGHARDLGHDRPGRVVESVGGARHAHEPRVDPHRRAKTAFAERLAAFLEAGDGAPPFDALVLVAPPRMLGDLRAALGQRAAARVVREIGKDLTRTPVARRTAYLLEALRR